MDTTDRILVSVLVAIWVAAAVYAGVRLYLNRPSKWVTTVDRHAEAVRNIRQALYLSLGVPEKQWADLDAALAKQPVADTPGGVIDQVLVSKPTVN